MSDRIQMMMTADLASLLFLALLALVGDLRFGTPDPVEDFLTHAGYCLGNQIDDPESSDSTMCGENIAKVARNTFGLAIGVGFVACEVKGKRQKRTQLEDCVENLDPDRKVVMLDFEEGVIRLPGTFKYNATERSKPDQIYLDHVTGVVGAMLGDHTARPGIAHISRRLSNSRLHLVIVDGHSDHTVRRSDWSSEPIENWSTDDLIKVGVFQFGLSIEIEPGKALIGEEAAGFLTESLKLDKNRAEFGQRIRQRLLVQDDNVRLAMLRAREIAHELTRKTNLYMRSTEEAKETPIISASLGCHRPLHSIGRVNQTNAKDDELAVRHDLACFRDDQSAYDPRPYLQPKPVDRDTKAAEVLEATQEAIDSALEMNRRAEIRVLFRLERD